MKINEIITEEKMTDEGVFGFMSKPPAKKKPQPIDDFTARMLDKKKQNKPADPKKVYGSHQEYYADKEKDVAEGSTDDPRFQKAMKKIADTTPRAVAQYPSGLIPPNASPDERERLSTPIRRPSEKVFRKMLDVFLDMRRDGVDTEEALDRIREDLEQSDYEWTDDEIASILGDLNVNDIPDIDYDDDIAEDLTEEFDLIESIVDQIAERNGVDAEMIWEDLESLSHNELYVFAVTADPIMESEAWQKANKKDRTDGMSQKAVNTYRREHPGSKLKTAVTTKPSKLKKGSKASKRRKSYCSRSRGQMKMHSISCSKTPDKAICKARRRWNC